MIAFFATLFLIPGSHEFATPGPVSIPLPGPDYIHLRWKSLRSSGYWEPPTLKLPFAGTYWVSAATKSKVRTIPAATFNQLLINDGLTVVQQYRKQYKQLSEPGRIVFADYAKTMITVGPPEPIAPVELNLPIEFILRVPQLVQLNFRSQPIEGVQISLNGKPIGITNGAGQLPLPLLNFSSKLTATVVRAYPDPSTAPWEFFNASLTLPPLSQRQAAIDNGQLPRNELGRRHEVNNGIGDLIASAESPSRSLRLQRLQGSTISLLKRDSPRSNAIHTDLRSPGPSHRPRHMNHPGLRGTVVDKFGPSLDAANRRDVHNPAPALLQHHPPRRLLSTKEVSLQVGRMDEVPIGFGHQQRVDLGKPRSVIHQPIQFPHFSK